MPIRPVPGRPRFGHDDLRGAPRKRRAIPELNSAATTHLRFEWRATILNSDSRMTSLEVRQVLAVVGEQVAVFQAAPPKVRLRR